MKKGVVDQHVKPVLQFSGGKDSLACFWLLEDWWDKLTVAWVNTGDAFPETLSLVEQVQSRVADFIEIKSDVHTHIARFGYPVDALPVRSHHSMRPMLLHPQIPLQSFFECCYANVMLPMHEKMKEIGATLIIRGQRASEAHRSPVRSGDVIDGVVYLFPIEDWSSGEVRRYLANKPIGLPDNYEFAGEGSMDTSLDCMHCTAYLSENIAKRRYMALRHPKAYQEVSNRLDVIGNAVSKELETILTLQEPVHDMARQ
jgi:phosphoadenosine phosphosulfate reductase